MFYYGKEALRALEHYADANMAAYDALWDMLDEFEANSGDKRWRRSARKTESGNVYFFIHVPVVRQDNLYILWCVEGKNFRILALGDDTTF